MTGGVDTETRALRGALEFAVLIGDELTKRKQGALVPKELRRWFGTARIPNAALGRLRRAVEADDAFRELLGASAVEDLVDPIGLLWLQRPPGWHDELARLLAARADERDEHDLRATVRREEKRRIAAEQAAVRTRVDLAARVDAIAALEATIDDLRADLAKADDAVRELRAEISDLRLEARHALDRERAAVARLAAEREARATVIAGPVEPEVSSAPPGTTVDPEQLAAAARAAGELAEALAAMAAPASPDPVLAPSARRDRRRPLALPGGVIASSSAAAEFLMRSDAAVLVDGYNVAKLGWPTRNLQDQRRALLDGLENATRRFGTDVTVVFDGTTVVGAHAPRRRLLRVVWSPEGVIADDVIRDEVRRLPTSRAVVVVTNDAEIIDDVRSLGANVVPANALLAII